METVFRISAPDWQEVCPVTQTQDERWAARDVMLDSKARPTVELRTCTRLRKMSLSRGLSVNTEVRGTTVRHSTYKHKTQSDTFTNGDITKDHLPVSQRIVGESGIDVNVIFVVFNQISILEFLSSITRL